jgi:hypothetical protein
MWCQIATTMSVNPADYVWAVGAAALVKKPWKHGVIIMFSDPQLSAIAPQAMEQ